MPAALSHALLLTAGLGTRLHPLTLVRAKPAVPVAGEPLVRRIVRWLVGCGVTDVVSNLHHLPASITSVLGDGSDLSVRVRYSWEQPDVLGSAGGPRQALDILGTGTFLIVNGDTLTDVDLPALIATHASSGALVTLALTRNPDPLHYSGVGLEGDCVVGFVPRGQTDVPSYHFVGVQVASAEAFRSLPVGLPARSIGGVYDDLIAAGRGTIRGFVSEARFWDVGTVSDYWNTSRTFSREETGGGQPTIGPRSSIDPAARIHDSILWDAVRVGAGAVLEECIVTDGVNVPADAVYRRVVLVQTVEGIVATPFDANSRPESSQVF